MLGFVNIYKPEGETSSRTVQHVKHVLINKLGCDKKIKVGHFGTLDPDACGVLPIAVGNACRLFDFSLNKTKIYLAQIVFGVETDTLDTHGKIIKSVDCDVLQDDLIQKLQEFPKIYDQIPPNVSAKSVGGVRAYKLARQGVEFSIPPKKVEIFDLSFVRKVDKNIFEISVECSSGTYIRSLCRDIGNLMGIPASMGRLERLKSGEFGVSTAVTKEEFESNPKECLISPDFILKNIPICDVSGDILLKMKNGVVIDCAYPDGEYKIIENNCVVGLAKVDNGKIKFSTRLQ